MNNNNINFIICQQIALAQVASDAGKNINLLFLKDCKKSFKDAQNGGYYLKDSYLLKALNLIRNNKSDWRYSIEIVPDQKGNKSNLVTFTLNNKGKFYQISFHNFSYYIKRMSGSGCHLFWDKKGSRKSVFKAYTLLGGKAFLK